MGIEPTRPAWKAGVLPLNYTRTFCDGDYYSTPPHPRQVFFSTFPEKKERLPAPPSFLKLYPASALHPERTGSPRTSCPRPFPAGPLHHPHPSINPISHMAPGENDPPADPQAGKPGLGCQAVTGTMKRYAALSSHRNFAMQKIGHVPLSFARYRGAPAAHEFHAASLTRWSRRGWYSRISRIPHPPPGRRP